MIPWQGYNVIRMVNKGQIHAKNRLISVCSFVKKIAQILLFVRLSGDWRVSSFRLIRDLKLSYTRNHGSF